MAVEKYFKLYPFFVSRTLQSQVSYRFDFILGIVANSLQQIVALIFLHVIFSNIPNLNGWTLYQIVFLLGFMNILSGLSELFLNGVWNISHEVNTGGMDKYLIRPVNPLFNILASTLELHGLGLIIFGVSVCGVSVVELEVIINIEKIFIFLITITSGTLMFFSINLIMATLSFWFINVTSSMVLVHHLSEFGKYPITIYSKKLQKILTYVIPFATVSYYPTTFLLDINSNFPLLLFSVAISIVFLMASILFFNFGLRRYRSAGG